MIGLPFYCCLKHDIRLASNLLGSWGWPWIPDPPASTSWVLRLQAWATMPGYDWNSYRKRILRIRPANWAVVVHTFNPNTQEAVAGRSLVSLRPAWSTEWVPGWHSQPCLETNQPPTTKESDMHRETGELYRDKTVINCPKDSEKQSSWSHFFFLIEG